MSIFWNKNFINDFKSLNNDKKVSTLLWKDQDEDIYAQLVDCIENKSDIILSEILPNELPSGTTLLEYKYFVNKFMFCPPHIFSKIENSSQAKTYRKIVIFDENHKGIFVNNIIRKVFLNELVKSMDFNLIHYNHTVDSLNEINDRLKNASKVILISQTPSLVSYIIQCSLVYNYEVNTHPNIRNSVRFFGLGLTIESDFNQSKFESVRENLTPFSTTI